MAMAELLSQYDQILSRGSDFNSSKILICFEKNIGVFLKCNIGQNIKLPC